MPCNTDEQQLVALNAYMNMNFYIKSNAVWIKSGGLWQEFKAHKIKDKRFFLDFVIIVGQLSSSVKSWLLTGS